MIFYTRYFNVRHHTRYFNIRYHTRYFNVRHYTRYFNIRQFQRVQNSAARLVLKKRKGNHVTPLLKDLHWLPVKCRCEYNMATFSWRHFDSTRCTFQLCTHQTSRALRSTSERLLKVPKRKLESFQESL